MTTTDNGQRDELARDIFIADNSAHPNAGAEWDAFEDIGGVCGGDCAYDIADGLIAAGYRKPRTITTVEELDALPHFALVRGMDGSRHERRRNAWLRVTQYETDPHETKYIELPAVVQYDPRAEVGY